MPEGSRQVRPWSVPVALTVAGLTVLGLGLRLPLFSDSLFGDELSSYFVVHGFGQGDVVDIVRSDQEGTPPLYFLLAWLTRGIGEYGEGLRLVPLLAGVASIPLTYLLGARTVGRPAALVGAAIVALSSFLIFYSTEARAYSLAMVLVLISALALLPALDGRGWGWWALYALAAAGAIYSHYTAVYVLIGQFGWALLAHPERRRALLVATAAAAVMYAPWLPAFIEDRDQPAAHLIETLHPLTLGVAYDDVLDWALGLGQDPGLFPPSSVGAALITLGLGLGVAGVMLRLHRSGARLPRPLAVGGGLRSVLVRGWEGNRGLALVVILALATPVGAALYSLVAPDIFLPRNLIASSPGMALLLGAVVTGGRGWLRLAATALLLLGFAIEGAGRLDADDQRPDYEGAVSYIHDHTEPGAPVAVVPEPSPGPQIAIEAASAPSGELGPMRNPVLPIGMHSLRKRVEPRGLEGGGVFAHVFEPTPTPQEVARRAGRLADGGKIVLVSWPARPFSEVSKLPGISRSFLSALPSGYRLAEERSFPGLNDSGPSVYVLEPSPSRPGP